MGPEFSIHNGKEEEEKRKMKHRQVRCPVYLDLIHSFAESLQTSFFTPSSFLSSARKEKKKGNDNSNNAFLPDSLQGLMRKHL